MKSISGKKFAKILEQNGWQLLRIQGSYRSRVAMPTVAVYPYLMKQASLSENDLK